MDIVSDLRQVGGFLRFPPPRKFTKSNQNQKSKVLFKVGTFTNYKQHDITEILLKVALNTIIITSNIPMHSANVYILDGN